MQSIKSRAFELMFRVLGKQFLNSEKLLTQEKGSPEPSEKIKEKYDIYCFTINGNKCYKMKPRKSKGGKSIVFLHGGAFVKEIEGFHWEMMSRIIDEIGCTFYVPIYPLAPQHRFMESFEMLLKLWNEITKKTDSKNLILLGDSAGGGMALSFAQLLNKRKLPMPKDIVLISPVLDMTLSNPDIKNYEKKDVVLGTKVLDIAYRAYAGEEDFKNPLLSPIYGDLEGLGKITLFIGGKEIFLPDVRKLKAMLEGKNISINYFEYESMFHDWVVMPIPEGRKAITQIVEIIK